MSKPTTHRVYMQLRGQRTSQKTTTEVSAVAEFAFSKLKEQSELPPDAMGVAWTRDNRQVLYHAFDPERLPEST